MARKTRRPLLRRRRHFNEKDLLGQMAGLWPTGGDHRLRHHTIVDIYVSGLPCQGGHQLIPLHKILGWPQPTDYRATRDLQAASAAELRAARLLQRLIRLRSATSESLHRL